MYGGFWLVVFKESRQRNTIIYNKKTSHDNKRVVSADRNYDNCSTNMSFLLREFFFLSKSCASSIGIFLGKVENPASQISSVMEFVWRIYGDLASVAGPDPELLIDLDPNQSCVGGSGLCSTGSDHRGWTGYGSDPDQEPTSKIKDPIVYFSEYVWIPS
jgi:hypothetical protein